MKIPPRTSRSKFNQSPRTWLLAIALVSLSLLSISGCNLMGISPVRKQPVPEKKVTTISESQMETLLTERKQLVERLEQLENQLQQNQFEYEARLKDMDRTIVLLEKNIVEIKNSVHKVNQKKPDKKQNVAESSPVRTVKKPPAPTPVPIPKADSDMVGEMRTPATSKAVETVSLLNPTHAKKGSSRKPDITKNRITQIVGINRENKKKKPAMSRQAWEDPDLDEPFSPIQLKIISGAKRRYQQAFKLYSNRNYATSINEFKRFVADFSSDQDADNSQFWIGQSHFQLGDYLQAERAFRKVLKNYAHGSTRRGYKTPDAALMLGRIYLIRKKPIKARYYFDRVVQRYPDSRSAVKAKKEIQAMDSF